MHIDCINLYTLEMKFLSVSFADVLHQRKSVIGCRCTWDPIVVKGPCSKKYSCAKTIKK